MVAMAKCAMVMTKIECYLPAIYRLNQEVIREESRIDTLYYKNQNTQIGYPSPYVDQLFSADAKMNTKSIFFSLFCQQKYFLALAWLPKRPMSGKNSSIGDSSLNTSWTKLKINE